MMQTTEFEVEGVPHLIRGTVVRREPGTALIELHQPVSFQGTPVDCAWTTNRGLRLHTIDRLLDGQDDRAYVHLHTLEGRLFALVIARVEEAQGVQ